METIWVNSADSHLLEPDDLWTAALPERLARRAPRTERDDKYETIWVDGERKIRLLAAFAEQFRPPGASDVILRLRDLDGEGVWGQLAFPSRGFWLVGITDPELANATVQTYNDWAAAEVIAKTGRILPAAMLPMSAIDDAITELERVGELGFQAVLLPTSVPEGTEYGQSRWEPLWSAIEASGLVAAFHIGTGADVQAYKGPGAAVVNYWETCVPGQRVVTHLVAAGVLERHPQLTVLIAEGGASWVPALADRLDEAYRQHGMYVQPKLAAPPSEYIFRQVYTSFQHDRSAVPTVTALGYDKVMWGDDYPHLEGTYGHTQKTLHELFDGVADEVRRTITLDNFERLFRVPARSPP